MASVVCCEKSIGIGTGNTFQQWYWYWYREYFSPKYWYWYWQYFSQVLLTTLIKRVYDRPLMFPNFV